MKSVFSYFAGFAVCLFLMASGLYAECRADEIKYSSFGTDRLAEEIGLDHLPSYLNDVYENDFYHSKISVHTRDIDKARIVFVNKALFYPKTKTLSYTFRGDTLLGAIGERLDNAVRELPVVKECDLGKDFHYTRYDAEKYAKKVYDASFLAVIRYKGRIIWYWNEEDLPDARLLEDGRFLVVTADSAFYITETKERLIAEVYSGNRQIWRGTANTGFFGVQHPEVKILTDNVVRQAYPDSGCVEHWKIRLSEEDAEKNRDKYLFFVRKQLMDPDGSEEYDDAKWREYVKKRKNKKNADPELRADHLAVDRTMLWVNGIGLKGTINHVTVPFFESPQIALKEQLMWCWHEGGDEPSAESYSEMSYEKTVGIRNGDVSSGSALATGKEGRAAETKDGFFASLFGRIKTFFAGLFA